MQELARDTTMARPKNNKQAFHVCDTLAVEADDVSANGEFRNPDKTQLALRHKNGLRLWKAALKKRSDLGSVLRRAFGPQVAPHRSPLRGIGGIDRPNYHWAWKLQ